MNNGMKKLKTRKGATMGLPMDNNQQEQLEVIKAIFESSGVTVEMLKEELKNEDSLERFEKHTQDMIRLLAIKWEDECM